MTDLLQQLADQLPNQSHVLASFGGGQRKYAIGKDRIQEVALIQLIYSQESYGCLQEAQRCTVDFSLCTVVFKVERYDLRDFTQKVLERDIFNSETLLLVVDSEY
jgi:hypothetical protein